jgi:hypothetical protein
MKAKSHLVPASQIGTRSSHARDQRVIDALTKALTTLEDELGGRTRLQTILAHSPTTTPALMEVLVNLADPLKASHSLGRICYEAGLTTGDLLKHYQGALKLVAQTLALRHVARDLPEVAKDVMKRALPSEECCEICLGTGTYVPEPTPKNKKPAPQRCITCNGTGKVILAPSLDRQQVALDLGELIPKKGGLTIGVQQSLQVATGSPAGLLERLQQAVSRISTEESSPIEADVLGEGDS